MTFYALALLLVIILVFVVGFKLSFFKKETTKILGRESATATHENLKEEKILCFTGSGDWDGKQCVCKYPNLVTNNAYNGNCDKVVINNCHTLFDTEGNVFDFETKNIMTDGICGCERDFIYDIPIHRCVLRKISDKNFMSVGGSNNIFGFEKEEEEKKKCGVGYVYSNKYRICVKSLCAWDILNPHIRINQKQLFPNNYNLCNCDVIRGFVPVKVYNGPMEDTVGCTKAFFNQLLPENLEQATVLVNPGNPDPYIVHLYPQTIAGTRIRQYLKNELSSVDDGTKMISVYSEVPYENWLQTIYKLGIKFYTKSMTQLLAPIFYKDATEEILLEIRPADHLPPPTLKPITLITLTDLEERGNAAGEKLFSPINDEEIRGETRYTINRILYSPLILGYNQKLLVNPAGVESNFYDYLLLHYYPESKTIIVETKKK